MAELEPSPNVTNINNNNSSLNGGPTQELPRSHLQSIWAIDLSIICLCAVTSLYVMVSLLVHEARRRLTPSGQKRVRAPAERNLANFTRGLCIAIAAMSLSLDALKLWSLYLENQATYASLQVPESAKALCATVPRAREVVLSLATGMCYLFLWARQSVFYISPSLAMLNNAKVKALSFALLALWLIYYIPAVVAQCFLVHHTYLEPGGCQATQESLPNFKLILISWVCVSVFMQIALLALFLNPILNRTSIRGHATKGKGSSRSYSRVIRRVKRAVLLTSVCLLSDVAAITITLALFRKDGNSITGIYSLNLVVNLLATVGCFDNWPGMMLPWCCCGRIGRKGLDRPSSSLTTPAPTPGISVLNNRSSVVESSGNTLQ